MDLEAFTAPGRMLPRVASFFVLPLLGVIQLAVLPWRRSRTRAE
jgi:hypothetical protein